MIDIQAEINEEVTKMIGEPFDVVPFEHGEVTFEVMSDRARRGLYSQPRAKVKAPPTNWVEMTGLQLALRFQIFNMTEVSEIQKRIKLRVNSLTRELTLPHYSWWGDLKLCVEREAPKGTSEKILDLVSEQFGYQEHQSDDVISFVEDLLELAWFTPVTPSR